jgi:hypothetical protein
MSSIEARKGTFRVSGAGGLRVEGAEPRRNFFTGLGEV